MASEVLESVKSKYGAVAESTLSTNDEGVRAVAEAFGYTAEELTSIPARPTWASPAAIPRQPRTSVRVKWS